MELLKPGSNETYGEVLFQSRPKTGRTVFWGIIILLPAVLLFVAFIIGIISPETIFIDQEDAFERAVPFILLGISLVWFIFGGIFVKNQFSVDVFENGIVVRRGSTLFSWYYSEIRGTAYMVNRQYLFIIPIPFLTTKKLNIYYAENDTEQNLDIGRLRLVNHREFSDTVQELFFKHRTAGVNLDNINELDMYFGGNFHLTNGNLTISQGLANTINNQIIPFENITKIDLGFARSHVDIIGINDKGKEARLFSTEATNMYNIDILEHFVAL